MTKSKSTVLTLKNDFLFKAVYGSDTEESKFILINLLNKILEREDNPIKRIEYKNPFQLKKYEDDKETILDIKAETDNDELIDIEMQITWTDDTTNRFIFYHGGLIRESLRESEDYATMKQTISICITDSTVFKQTENYINKFYFMEENDHFVYSKITCIYVIELPKVNPDRKPIDELTPLEICLEYLKHADENKSDYVDELIHRGGKELKMANEILRKTTEEERLRERALAREKYLRDQASFAKRKAELSQKEADLTEKEADLTEKEADLTEKEADLTEKEADLIEKEADLIEKEADLTEKEADLIEKEEGLTQKETKLTEKEKSLGKKEKYLDEKLDKAIRNLKASGFKSKDIAAVLGLTEEKIKKL